MTASLLILACWIALFYAACAVQAYRECSGQTALDSAHTAATRRDPR